MVQKKKQKTYSVVIVGILLLTALGIGLVLEAYRNYRSDFIQIQDEKQRQLAQAVDRNVGSLLDQCEDGLTYMQAQEGFAAAEATWLRDGDPKVLLEEIRQSYLVQNGLVTDVVVLRDGKAVLSMQEKDDYIFYDADGSGQRICLDGDKHAYLAMVASGRGKNNYAAIVDIEKIYQAVSVEELAEADQLLLLDRTHSIMLHFCVDEQKVKATKIEACPKREDFRLLIADDEAGTQACHTFVYQTQRMNEGYNAHIVTLPVAKAANGSFAIGLISNIDKALQPLQTASLRWLTGGLVVLLGISLLLVMLLHYKRRDAQIARELELLRQKNQSMEELNRKTREMAHHQRLEMIGTLASGVAHEFNNLLTPIMGYSMLSLEQLPPDQEAVYDNILEIYNTSHKAREITAQLSQYARKAGNEVKEELRVDRLLSEVLRVAMPACPEGVKVDLRSDCGGAAIYGNETQLSQLFLNLILNAFHAMGEGEGRLTISGGVERGQVRIVLQDTGCGISEEVLPRIFEPFFTTKEGGQGTGLGLAIVQQIAEDHQGHIEVVSREGEGSRFTVYLPVYDR